MLASHYWWEGKLRPTHWKSARVSKELKVELPWTQLNLSQAFSHMFHTDVLAHPCSLLRS